VNGVLAPRRGLPGLPWPLPALLAWAVGWALWFLALGLGAPAWLAGATALAGSLALALRCQGAWRRSLAAAGFPLSWVVLGAAQAVPPWAWALAALPLVLLYPLRTWRDAPFFPTPARALHGLDAVIGLPAPQRVLDAGCGVGHGLRELAALWPQAALQGVEWSRPLSALARWRCPAAQVRRGDMWADDWGTQDLVYLFQRPETMPRAAAKAAAEMRPGTWLVSLEFAVPGWQAQACLQPPDGRSVWVYRMPTAAVSGAVGRAQRTPHSTAGPEGR
jgi:SAM-dependent methyltransferase